MFRENIKYIQYLARPFSRIYTQYYTQWVLHILHSSSQYTHWAFPVTVRYTSPAAKCICSHQFITSSRCRVQCMVQAAASRIQKLMQQTKQNKYIRNFNHRNYSPPHKTILCVCVCVCVCIYLWLYSPYIYIYIHIFVYLYKCVCVCVCERVCMYVLYIYIYINDVICNPFNDKFEKAWQHILKYLWGDYLWSYTIYY